MKFILLLLLLISFNTKAQESDSILIRNIYNMALSEGHSYENLRSLCKDIGARITGSAQADLAIQWAKEKLESYNFDKVYLQEIKVPHWERGTKEVGWYRTSDGTLTKLEVLALGGSIGTNGMLTAEVIEFETLESLKTAKAKDVKGKIVFINEKMNEQLINTFAAYGACYPIRKNGCAEASLLGAKAVVIRSLGLAHDDFPHTGTLKYTEDVAKIPGAAISTLDAEALSIALKKGKVEFIMEMDCRSYPDKTSYNVIAEMIGEERPEAIITFGGHLDSWDVGEGAHDDGAGVVHSIEALRILKTQFESPKHTLRLVLWMNEENGNMGGKTYAKIVSEKGEEHIAAVESDRGGFSPRGFTLNGSEQQLEFLKSFESVLGDYGLRDIQMGYPGVDIKPMRDYFKEMLLIGFVPDSQRYFDFHHTNADVFENVNKRELELGSASMAAILFLLDKYLP